MKRNDAHTGPLLALWYVATFRVLSEGFHYVFSTWLWFLWYGLRHVADVLEAVERAGSIDFEYCLSGERLSVCLLRREKWVPTKISGYIWRGASAGYSNDRYDDCCNVSSWGSDPFSFGRQFRLLMLRILFRGAYARAVRDVNQMRGHGVL